MMQPLVRFIGRATRVARLDKSSSRLLSLSVTRASVNKWLLFSSTSGHRHLSSQPPPSSPSSTTQTAAQTAAKPSVIAAAANKKNRMSFRERLLWTLGLGGLFGVGVGIVYEFGAPQPEDTYLLPTTSGEKIIDQTKYHPGLQVDANENVVMGYFRRLGVRFDDFVKHFSEPSAKKLLPDPLPEPYGRPYTLILDLDETIIHAEWTPKSGWKVMKRPGIDTFIAYLSNFYEIVVFTHQLPMYGDPILNKLDPKGYIMYRLYRDGTKYVNGHHLKDLSVLNRDVRKVIVMDDEAVNFSLQPANGIVVPPWKGEPHDDYLMKMIPFLETLAMSNIEDVRTVLQQYQGKDIPEVFAENQRRFAEVKARQSQKQSKGLSSLFKGREVDITEQQAMMRQTFLREQQMLAQQQQTPQTTTTTTPPEPTTVPTQPASTSSSSQGFFGWLTGKQ